MRSDSENHVKDHGRMSPYFCQRLLATASIRSESLARYILAVCCPQERIWKGDTLIEDIEDIHRWTHLKSMRKGLMQRKCLTPKMVKVYLPDRRWNSQTVRGRSSSENIHFNTAQTEEQKNIFWENETGHHHIKTHRRMLVKNKECSTPCQDSSPNDAEARADFWSTQDDFISCHHIERRVHLCEPREVSFPIPLTFFDVTRATSASLDAAVE